MSSPGGEGCRLCRQSPLAGETRGGRGRGWGRGAGGPWGLQSHRPPSLLSGSGAPLGFISRDVGDTGQDLNVLGGPVMSTDTTHFPGSPGGWVSAVPLPLPGSRLPGAGTCPTDRQQPQTSGRHGGSGSWAFSPGPALAALWLPRLPVPGHVGWSAPSPVSSPGPLPSLLWAPCGLGARMA